MFHIVKQITCKLKPPYIIKLNKNHFVQIRNVTALYISGDKASENCATIQPYTDFAGTFANLEKVELSVQKRKLQIDLKHVTRLYEKYSKALKEIDEIEEEREMVATQLKELSKSKQNEDEDLINQLKTKGKQLRNDLKLYKNRFHPIEDEFMQIYLDLPNLLNRQCPEGEFERTLYRNAPLPETAIAESHLNNDNLIEFIDNTRYYMKNEAAEFDIFATDALAQYIRSKGGFIQTSNPDFVRHVLLEANSTPLQQFHKVMESQLQSSVNYAYLTGGASFESYLGAVTKLCVFPSVIPLKYVCTGRIYEKNLVESHTPSLYTATQTNAVQTFVASRDQQESEEQMDALLNLCVDFYKCFTNLHFRVVYVKAAELTASESLRAQIEAYSPSEKRYVCVGRVSNYSDYVSKRILFTMREQKNLNFPHLVGGPVLYTSRLIAALIECGGELLNYEQILQTLKIKKSSEDKVESAVDEFKSLFK